MSTPAFFALTIPPERLDRNLVAAFSDCVSRLGFHVNLEVRGRNTQDEKLKSFQIDFGNLYFDVDMTVSSDGLREDELMWPLFLSTTTITLATHEEDFSLLNLARSLHSGLNSQRTVFHTTGFDPTEEARSIQDEIFSVHGGDLVFYPDTRLAIFDPELYPQNVVEEILQIHTRYFKAMGQSLPEPFPVLQETLANGHTLLQLWEIEQ